MHEFYALEEAGPKLLERTGPVHAFEDLYSGLALGVYTVMRTFGHTRFLHLEGHIARTLSSMASLGWDLDVDESRLRENLYALCAACPWPEMRVRYDVLASAVPGTTTRETLALLPFTPLAASVYEQGVRVSVIRNLKREDAKVKDANFVPRRSRALAASGAYEGILTDSQDRLLEGLSSNFYAFDGVSLRTAGAGVLEGVTRRIILKLAQTLGISVSLEPVAAAELPNIPEAAISSSSQGLIAVTSVDHLTIGTGTPGAVFEQLRQAYDAYVAAHARSPLARSPLDRRYPGSED